MTTSAASETQPVRHRLPARAAAPVAVGTAAVVSIAVCALVAAIAHSAGASDDFRPLQLSTFAPLIVIGLVAGAVGWSLIRSRSASPARVLQRVVPAVVLVSLVPDIAVGVSQSMPHTTWGAVAALMLMHVVVAAAGVAAFRTFLPLRDSA